MISEYWKDIVIYTIEFVAVTTGIKRRYRKILVSDAEIKKEDISHLVEVYFENIDKVLYVDGLYLKGR